MSCCPQLTRLTIVNWTRIWLSGLLSRLPPYMQTLVSCEGLPVHKGLSLPLLLCGSPHIGLAAEYCVHACLPACCGWTCRKPPLGTQEYQRERAAQGRASIYSRTLEAKKLRHFMALCAVMSKWRRRPPSSEMMVAKVNKPHEEASF